MKVKKLFQKTLFGIFVVFGCIGLATSILTVYTVDTHLSEEYESNASNHRQDHRRLQRGHPAEPQSHRIAVADRPVR